MDLHDTWLVPIKCLAPLPLCLYKSTLNKRWNRNGATREISREHHNYMTRKTSGKESWPYSLSSFPGESGVNALHQTLTKTADAKAFHKSGCRSAPYLYCGWCFKPASLSFYKWKLSWYIYFGLYYRTFRQLGFFKNTYSSPFLYLKPVDWLEHTIS